MTATNVANPRRTSLSALDKGSELATCQAAGCHNVAVSVVAREGVRRLTCRAHA